ncbi:putative bifunctional diguanylate cyclase/phosphodiesterase [Plantactinospora sp. GCM10030261]|uniref:putative bifunctional diguanylate cyclase/phosphodiesterase n=1 Tax=Plantactinospora sp. GCM10030261 TaxID=3273420 RepID=UPI003607913F
MGRVQPARRRSTDHAWLLTAPLALTAAVCSTILALIEKVEVADLPVAGLLLAAAIVAASVPVLHVVTLRQGLALTLTEIPLVVALYWLPPLLVAIIGTVAGLVTQVYRRASPPKFWFNVAATGASVSVAALVYAVLPASSGGGPAAWLPLFVAVITNNVIGLGSVVGVISLLQGWEAGRDILRPASQLLTAWVTSIVVGLIILIALRETPWSALLLVVLAGAGVAVYRSYARFVRQHRTLGELYELTRAMSESGKDGTLPDALLGRVRKIMQAEHATLWLPARGRHPEVLLTARVDERGLLDQPDVPAIARERAYRTGETVAFGARLNPDRNIAPDLRRHGVKDLLVVPLRSGSAVIGTLEVANRLSDIGHFTPSEIPVLETVAAHVAVALENSRLVDRLRFDAYHDGLTQLPNRRRMTAALTEAVQVRAPGEVVAVLLFDVDDLRRVNETLGYAAGDKVLVEVADRLRASAPSSALVGRTGGDEFLVLLRLDSAEAAVDLAARLREQIRDRMVFGELTVDVETAAGVAVDPDHGTEPALLLQRVEVAAIAAKSTPDGVQLFNPALESRSLHRLGLAADLRGALDAGELEVYFQPKVTLRDRRLVGVECLARWEHPTHGVVAPEDFVAIAEHTGLLDRLTETVLREGLRRSRDWPDTDRPLNISVNLSGRTLTDPQFPNRVKALLAEYGIPAERLTLELREDAVLDGTDRMVPALRRLREAGVRLSVDDFGTGYSSLSYLRRLPVHEVKVDRSFVQGMATDPVDLAIVNAVVTLSQQFGLAVVAEGVESELTLELLQDIGCQIGQGFLFSRPLPYERLAAWVEAHADPEPLTAADVRRLRAVP